MKGRSHKPKEAYSSDPLVPIDPRRLKAAIDANDVSIQKLAKSVGQHSQTLDHLVKGDHKKRCRLTRRRELARRLDVPDAWLEGTREAVPELREIPHEVAVSLSPRLQLAMGRLLRKAVTAIRRDLKAAPLAREAREIPIPDAILVRDICWYLSELTRLTFWREALTTWRDTRERPFVPNASGLLQDLPELREQEEDRVSLAMVTMLEAVLDPWFDGMAQLDYERLRVLIGYDRRGTGEGPAHPRYQGKPSSPEYLIASVALGNPE
jgi:hypothetical protein